MRLDLWDAGFVRTTRAAVHPIVADVACWGTWWPGCTTRPLASAVEVRLVPPRPLAPPLRFVVAVTKERKDLGVDLQLTGDLQGAGEWYYLDERAGSVLHAVLHVDVADRGWRRTAAGVRASTRAALHALKDRLEGGRLPGTEPHPDLLAHQAAAAAAFRAAANAHAARMAALGGAPPAEDA